MVPGPNDGRRRADRGAGFALCRPPTDLLIAVSDYMKDSHRPRHPNRDAHPVGGVRIRGQFDDPTYSSDRFSRSLICSLVSLVPSRAINSGGRNRKSATSATMTVIPTSRPSA